MTHFGVNGQAHCGASHLLGGMTTHDVPAVDCTACLWQMLGEGLNACDRIAFRLRTLFAERAPS